MARHIDGQYSRGGDQNNTANNTDFNRGPRDHASAREMEGMDALARPSGLARKSTTGSGCPSDDTPHVATNDETWVANDETFNG